MSAFAGMSDSRSAGMMYFVFILVYGIVVFFGFNGFVVKCL